jgi:heptose III glucuronosyltransferase
MPELKLSIIIPFYNVEKYITQCLESIYSQDIPESEYEVICVNDCSPDNSREIVLEYQKNHPNLILLEHDKNKMLGAARNTGLLVARGKYIWFIDSDDYIKENILGKLLKIAEENDLEILHFNSLQFTDEGEFSNNEVFFPSDTDVITGIDFLNSPLVSYWKKSVTAWTKIYSTDFLRKNDLFFPESVFFEDNVHTLKALLLASRFQYVSDCIYYWRINPESIMNSHLEGGIKRADSVHYCCACMEVLEAYKFLPFYDEIEARYLLHLRLFNGIKQLLRLPVKEKWLYYKRMKTFDRSILFKNRPFRYRLIYTHPLLVFFPLSH